MNLKQRGRTVLICLAFTLFIFSQLNSQNRAMLRSNGDQVKLERKADLREALLKTSVRTGQNSNVVAFLSKTNEYEDVLRYMEAGEGDVRFGYDPGDVLVQWFEAPTDIDINAIGFYTNDVVAPEASVEVKIVKLTWSKAQIESFTSAYHLGYYEAAPPFYRVPFLEDEGSTGTWAGTENAATSPFGNYLWSSNGLGIETIPVNGADVWVEMSLLDSIPSLKKGEIFGVVVKNISSTGTDVIRIEALSGGPVPGFKYYKSGRLVTDPNDPNYDPGWYIRTNYTWNMAVAVTYTGDTPPTITNVTKLITTISTEPRTVSATITDLNPTGGESGVAQALLRYRVNDGGWSEEIMSGVGDIFEADIPGQSEGSKIEYFITASDVFGNSSKSSTFQYEIFEQLSNVLVVFNGPGDSSYPRDFYFRKYYNVNDYWDKWAYGPLSEEFLKDYLVVFEICTGGPLHDNRSVIKDWLSKSGLCNYFLSGEDFLGAFNNYQDKTYVPGDFEYDVLGISASYNDVSFDGTSGYEIPSHIRAIEDSDLGGALYDDFSASGTDSLRYDPHFELGQPTNRIDGFNVSSAEVDIEVETRGINGIPTVEWKPVAAHNTTPQGNKIAFMALDPLAINSSPEYVWWGDSTSNIQYKAVDWMTYHLPYSCPRNQVVVGNVSQFSSNYYEAERFVQAEIYVRKRFNCERTTEGISKVELHYQIGKGDYTTIEMNKLSPGQYQGKLPQIEPGNDVSYYVRAFENEGHNSISAVNYFSVFEQTDATSLVILNGYNKIYEKNISEYFINASGTMEIECDRIGGAQLSEDIVNRYNNIFEFNYNQTNTFNNNTVIKKWLLEGDNRNYLICGENWIAKSSTANFAYFSNNSFEKEIFGMDLYRKNINRVGNQVEGYLYSFPDTSSNIGQQFIPLMRSVADSLRISGVSFDGFRIEAGKKAKADLTAKTVQGEYYEIAGHRELDNGNKVAFVTVDVNRFWRNWNGLWWIIHSQKLPGLYAVWFGVVTDVNEDEERQTLPTSYSLSQNYPNPFNPTTTIAYSIPHSQFSILNSAQVSLRIFDILGREVVTLVNKQQKPGSYKVEWNAGNAPSGVYFYKLDVTLSLSKGEHFTDTKKLLLLK